MPTHTCTVAIDYYQFYLWDRSVTDQAPEDYSEEDVRRRVKLAPSCLVVQPARNGDVTVELSVEEVDPGFEAGRWDHVVECSIDLPGGQLEVHECLGGAALDIEVEPGFYAARVLFSGLGRPSTPGLEGQDRYSIQLWPDSPRSLRVVRQWDGDTD